jgi:ribonuclease-3
MLASNLEKFCKKIEHQFSNEFLLDEALTHPSLSKKQPTKANYQRLEFLGDKVLSLIIGEFLFKEFPHEDEGALSRRHAAVVSGLALAEIALEIGLEEVLQISSGEEKMGGKTNKRNLENALEALIGAIYLDDGFLAAQKFVMKFWSKFLAKDLTPPKDPVSQLQELVQLQSKCLPIYSTEKSGGSDHEPHFISIVSIPSSNQQFSASGKSKKEAQKEVAQVALKHLLK